MYYDSVARQNVWEFYKSMSAMGPPGLCVVACGTHACNKKLQGKEEQT